MSIIVFLISIFVSSILQGITGFSFALLATPLVLYFYDQQTTVVVLTLVSLSLNLFLIEKIKTKVNRSLVTQIIVFGLVGVVVGVLALLSVDTTVLKLSVGILSITFTFILFSPKYSFREHKPLTITIGFITGFLQSSIGLSGPPLVLMLTGYGINIKEIRKTLAEVFFFLSIFTIPLFIWKDILTWDRFLLGMLSIPFAMIGGSLGNKISDKVPKHVFKIVSLILILIVSLQLVLKTIIEMYFI